MQTPNVDESRSQALPRGDWTEADRETVTAELNNILSDPAFKRSHRCVALLRYLVEHTLADDLTGIKERTLGVEVFGRDYDYDSNADPIVRMTTNEIRKRLAQYYQNNEARQVRIRLVPGRYIPEFELLPPVPLEPPPFQQAAAPAADPASQLPPASPPSPQTRSRFTVALARPWIIGAAVLMIAVAAVILFSRSTLFPSPQNLVWQPLLSSRTPATIVVADNSALEMKGVETLSDDQKRIQMQRIADMIKSRQAPPVPDLRTYNPTTPFVDAHVAHSVSSWFAERGRTTSLRPSSALALGDFRSRPVILIGGFDNPWTVILLSDLRFLPQVDPATGTFWIGDARNPGNRVWARHVLEEAQPSFDYAVIARFFATETGDWIFAIGGLGPHGTEAASQLLTDPAFAKSIPRGVKSTGNFETVVGTRVINGSTGPPQVLAFYAW